MIVGKRLFDIAFSLCTLVVFSPLLLCIAILIRADSRGDTLFSQMRIGLKGEPFKLFKFRSMKETESTTDSYVTVKGDKRITRVGRLLRKTKLDELPQLFNVLIGDMSIVGPRPEVSKYMSLYEPWQRDIILSVRPGLTDFAAIALRDEEVMLAAYSDPEKAYRDVLMPRKFELYRQYVEQRSMWVDIKLILGTLVAIVMPSRMEPEGHE
jgi:lipopolysaccharide/colanic/teichoic acid biosynthesis glycosyltransferase